MYEKNGKTENKMQFFWHVVTAWLSTEQTDFNPDNSSLVNTLLQNFAKKHPQLCHIVCVAALQYNRNTSMS